MRKSVEYTNHFGDRRTAIIRASFTDEDGNRFLVIGPVPRGSYDVSPPYDILQYTADDHVLK